MCRACPGEGVGVSQSQSRSLAGLGPPEPPARLIGDPDFIRPVRYLPSAPRVPLCPFSALPVLAVSSRHKDRRGIRSGRCWIKVLMLLLLCRGWGWGCFGLCWGWDNAALGWGWKNAPPAPLRDTPA